jgi:hypothetical protein
VVVVTATVVVVVDASGAVVVVVELTIAAAGGAEVEGDTVAPEHPASMSATTTSSMRLIVTLPAYRGPGAILPWWEDRRPQADEEGGGSHDLGLTTANEASSDERMEVGATVDSSPPVALPAEGA